MKNIIKSIYVPDRPTEESLQNIDSSASYIHPEEEMLQCWHEQYIKHHRVRFARNLDIVNDYISHGNMGLAETENINYLQAIKRVVGMIDKPLANDDQV